MHCRVARKKNQVQVLLTWVTYAELPVRQPYDLWKPDREDVSQGVRLRVTVAVQESEGLLIVGLGEQSRMSLGDYELTEVLHRLSGVKSCLGRVG